MNKQSDKQNEEIDFARKDTRQCFLGSHAIFSVPPKQAGQNIPLPQEGQPDTVKNKEPFSLSKHAPAPSTFIARVLRRWGLDLLAIYTASLIINSYLLFISEPILPCILSFILLVYLSFSLWSKAELSREKMNFPGYIFALQLILLILLYPICSLLILLSTSDLTYPTYPFYWANDTLFFLYSLDITPLPLVVSLYHTFIFFLLTLSIVITPLRLHFSILAIIMAFRKLIDLGKQAWLSIIRHH